MVIRKFNICIDIHQVVWFCFMLGLLTFQLKTELYYFNKTHFIIFKQAKIEPVLTEETRNWIQGFVKISNYLMLAFIDQHTTCFKRCFVLNSNEKKFAKVFCGKFC